eukprot:scaffold105687_cov21-Tisochrysis_lutea.AAC.1
MVTKSTRLAAIKKGLIRSGSSLTKKLTGWALRVRSCELAMAPGLKLSSCPPLLHPSSGFTGLQYKPSPQQLFSRRKCYIVSAYGIDEMKQKGARGKERKGLHNCT